MTKKIGEELNDALRDIATTPINYDTRDMMPQSAGSLTPTQAAELVAMQNRGWLDQPTETIADQLERRSANRATLLEWVRANLKEGHDYGVIKNKKSLWKAGAEKIAGMLGLQVTWPDLEAELERLRGGATTVFLSCELVRDGQVQAQGAGARSVDEDGGNFNKAIKMCKKSAMIDAVLNVGGLSEVFTQDLEDDYDKSTLSEDAQDILFEHAVEKTGDEAKARAWLQSLARRRFHIGDGDWSKIPSFRLNDAIRSISEKAEQNEHN